MQVALSRAVRYLTLGLGMGLGCGPILDDLGELTDGTPCYRHEDCVPADCCGESEGVAHVDERGSCEGVVCTSACDPSKVGCGCGVPVCREQRCAVAYGETC